MDLILTDIIDECVKMSEKELYKKCKHNTSESAGFDGYCDLYMNEDRTAGRLVECSKCPCDDFELRGEEE